MGVKESIRGVTASFAVQTISARKSVVSPHMDNAYVFMTSAIDAACSQIDCVLGTSSKFFGIGKAKVI